MELALTCFSIAAEAAWRIVGWSHSNLGVDRSVIICFSDTCGGTEHNSRT
jgi:hypothetical protein